MQTAKRKSPSAAKSFERLEARISPDQKELFKKAAALEGRSLTDFVVSCVVQEARRVVQESESIKLSERDRQCFVMELLHPTTPSIALHRAATWYLQKVRQP